MDLPPPQLHHLHLPPGNMHTATAPTTHRVDGPRPRPGVLEIQTRGTHGGNVGFEVVEFCSPGPLGGVVDGDALAAGFAGCGEVGFGGRGGGGRVDV